MLDSVATYVKHVIDSMGYPGLFLLIVLESTLVPVPSMLVMPFAGYLASTGRFSLPAILAINGAAAITGSLVSYAIGAAGGKPLLERYGKYVMVRPDDLRKTEEFFARHGAWTVLIARFLPVVRHLISIPAGIARMKLPVFVLQTLLGASIWGGGLMIVGYEIGANWESFARTAKRLDLVVAVLIVVVIVALAVRFWRRRRAQRQPGVGEPTRSVSPP
jgi:membrane protein DedA with SNARE-associated domain